MECTKSKVQSLEAYRARIGAALTRDERQVLGWIAAVTRQRLYPSGDGWRCGPVEIRPAAARGFFVWHRGEQGGALVQEPEDFRVWWEARRRRRAQAPRPLTSTACRGKGVRR